ncbi:potassium channel subfamily K member 16-like [Chiloscyllium plagiosum]|uniref:potassium channel subfamily K member 16-like n=1 Tax=Chiloscyllium plagiosum TaxID=36176 RepID=UPI001CB7D573|nr:potassium channel subfamily K member 16-like [Chiloscyllium plagiosum]
MSYFTVHSIRVSWTVILLVGYFVYLFLGAAVFQMLEKQAESRTRSNFQLEKLKFLTNYSCLDGPALERFVQIIIDAWDKGVNPTGNSTNPSNWDFSSSFFFAGTVVTTIGFGNLSPSTVGGQVFCVFYAIFGVPLNLTFLNYLGRSLNGHLKRLERSSQKSSNCKQVMKIFTMAFFLIFGTVLFLVFPPLVFSHVEDWTYGESFYFAFITLSTIGFGDYVVGTDPDKHYISIYRGLAGVWIVIGLAWLALLFNMGSRVLEQILQLKWHRNKSNLEVMHSSKQEDCCT